jgi:hypothetical protein
MPIAAHCAIDCAREQANVAKTTKNSIIWIAITEIDSGLKRLRASSDGRGNGQGEGRDETCGQRDVSSRVGATYFIAYGGSSCCRDSGAGGTGECHQLRIFSTEFSH